MKHTILIIVLLAFSTISTKVLGQVQISGTSDISAVLPKKKCNVLAKHLKFSLKGLQKKTFTLVKKNAKFSKYRLFVRATSGSANVKYSILINGKNYRGWTWPNSAKEEPVEKIIELTEIQGKEVTLIVKNNSVSKKTRGLVQAVVRTNNMLLSSAYEAIASDRPITRKLTKTSKFDLTQACNGKGTIEVTRLKGASRAEIVVRSREKGGRVLKVVPMAANETSKRINIDSKKFLSVVIRDIEKTNSSEPASVLGSTKKIS